MAGFDKAALERLEALGRRRGHLTTGDLAGELPISGMAPDEIALVIVHLEDRGIPVEVDADLLAGERRPAAPPMEPGLILPDLAPGPFPVVATAGAPGAAPLPGPPPDADAVGGGFGSTHRAVAIAGVAVLAILFAALFLLRGG